jgi:hypothetical protein
MTPDPAPPILDPDNAAFLQSGLSISVASRDADHVASVAKAVACRVSDDRRRITVFLPGAPASRLVADIRACGAIAVCFSEPKTHRTLQLKGTDAREVPIAAADEALIVAQAAGVVAQLDELGYSATLGRVVFPPTAEGVVAIAFTPTAGFAQTPGPQAGRRLA